MKIFLSWSGQLSLGVATVLRDWLPGVIQAVRPYLSAEDIDKGARWSTDIAAELELSIFGILCITRNNLNAPWINFEAGALSKTIEKSNVTPFLFGLRPSDVTGPLLQFQATLYTQEDVGRLLSSINRRLSADDRLDDGRLAKAFEMWWPQLQEQLDALPAEDAHVEPEPMTSMRAVLDELLALSRSQQKVMRSPEALLPAEYLRRAIAVGGFSPDKHVRRQMHDRIRRAQRLAREIKDHPENAKAIDALLVQLEKLHDTYHGRAEVVRQAPLLPVVDDQTPE